MINKEYPSASHNVLKTQTCDHLGFIRTFADDLVFNTGEAANSRSNGDESFRHKPSYQQKCV